MKKRGVATPSRINPFPQASVTWLQDIKIPNAPPRSVCRNPFPSGHVSRPWTASAYRGWVRSQNAVDGLVSHAGANAAQFPCRGSEIARMRPVCACGRASLSPCIMPGQLRSGKIPSCHCSKRLALAAPGPRPRGVVCGPSYTPWYGSDPYPLGRLLYSTGYPTCGLHKCRHQKCDILA